MKILQLDKRSRHQQRSFFRNVAKDKPAHLLKAYNRDQRKTSNQ